MPDWAVLSRARIWNHSAFEEKRRFLMTKKVQVETIRSSDDALVTLRMKGDKERGTISIFDASKGTIPNSVRQNKFAYGVSPAPSAGMELNPFMRQLLDQTLPVLLWGPHAQIRACRCLPPARSSQSAATASSTKGSCWWSARPPCWARRCDSLAWHLASARSLLHTLHLELFFGFLFHAALRPFSVAKLPDNRGGQPWPPPCCTTLRLVPRAAGRAATRARSLGGGG